MAKSDLIPIYDIEKIICQTGQAKSVYQLEEDVLVPDIKPDMEEILIAKAICDAAPAEKTGTGNSEDFVWVSGNVSIQVLYKGQAQEVVNLEAKIPYKYKWPDALRNALDAEFACEVKKLDYMMVSDRKIRFKVTLEFTLKLKQEKQLSIFSGVKDDSLEIKKELICFNRVSKVYSDELEIVETIKKSSDVVPACVLWQDYQVSENYRQVTGDKIVLNGFIYVNVIYKGESGENGGEDPLVQCRDRLEFTQFIPLGREEKGKNIILSEIDYDLSDFATTACAPLTGSDETDSYLQKELQCKGALKTRATLYEKYEKEIAVDAYHRQKDFVFNKKEALIDTLENTFYCEFPVHQIINLETKLDEESRKVGQGYFSDCSLEGVKVSYKGNRAVLNGTVCYSFCYRDEAGQFRRKYEKIPFEEVLDRKEFGMMNESCELCLDYSLREISSEVISQSQAEIKAIVVSTFKLYGKVCVPIICDGNFVENGEKKNFQMVITTVGPKDTLWDIAKRYKTTPEAVMEVNNIEGDSNLKIGSRILIVK